MNNSKHYTAAIAAFTIWGFFSLPLRALNEYTSGQILYFRILFSFVILVIVTGGFTRNTLQKDIVAFRALMKPERIKIVVLTLVGGLLLTVNWLTFIYIVNNINIKTASFSYLVCPVITAMLGFFILKERMTVNQWIAVGLCAVSCAMIGISSLTELGFSVLTAFTYALYLITQRKNQGFDRMVILGIQVGLSLLLLTVFARDMYAVVPAEGSFYGMIFLVATLFTVFPLFLNLYALSGIKSASIGILMYINPLINFTLAFVLFKEKMDMLQLVGYAVIAVALVLFNYQNFARLRARTA